MAVRQGQQVADDAPDRRRSTTARRLRRLVTAAVRILALARRTVTLPSADRRTTVRALPVLLFVEALIRWVPLPRLARWLGLSMATSRSAPDEAQRPLTDTVRGPTNGSRSHTVSCVQRLAREWPLGAGPCLRESLVLGFLLREEAPALHLGVARSPRGKLRAHAWIEIDGEAVNDPLGYQPFAGAATRTTT